MRLKADKARVMMPMVMPPRRRVTQQQHRLTHGILRGLDNLVPRYSWWQIPPKCVCWLPAQLLRRSLSVWVHPQAHWQLGWVIQDVIPSDL